MDMGKVIEQLERENALLKRENRALEDDNYVKCEEIERLKKAFNRACTLLSKDRQVLESEQGDPLLVEWTSDQWKAWCLEDE